MTVLTAEFSTDWTAFSWLYTYQANGLAPTPVKRRRERDERKKKTEQNMAAKAEIIESQEHIFPWKCHLYREPNVLSRWYVALKGFHR